MSKLVKNIKIVLFILFIALSFMIINSTIYSYGQDEIFRIVVNVVENAISPEQMLDDMNFLTQKLKNVHPAAYRGFNQKQQTSIDAAYEQIRNSPSMSSFFFTASTVIASFDDTYTNFAMNSNGKCIDVPIISLNDGFFIRETTEHLQKGDKLISMGNMTMDSIFHKIKDFIPSENDKWRKVRMAQWIALGYPLDYLGLINNDSVSISIERNGVPVTEKTILQSCENIDWWKNRITKDSIIGYTIYSDYSLGMLYIDYYYHDDYFQNTLHSFFREVAEKGIKNIAIDLRQGTYGNNYLVREILSYFNVDKYKDYGAEMRFSAETKAAEKDKRQKGSIKKKPGNFSNRKLKKDPKLLFEGNLFVMTSAQTAGTAIQLATTIKDNNLGTIIGEPTGIAPSFFGDTLKFTLPNSKFDFSVSFKKFTRPGRDNNPPDALYPDITVYTTSNDLLLSADPQLEKIKNIILNR